MRSATIRNKRKQKGKPGVAEMIWKVEAATTAACVPFDYNAFIAGICVGEKNEYDPATIIVRIIMTRSGLPNPSNMQIRAAKSCALNSRIYVI